MKTYFLLFISALLMMGCVEEKSLDNSTVMVHSSFEPKSIHITNDQSSLRSHIYMYTQRTLVRLDLKTLKQVPLLTEGLGLSDDGITFRYKLRKDVKFSPHGANHLP